MIGIILVAIGAFFSEVSMSIGKVQVLRRRQSIYTMGYLYLFWAAVILFGTAIIYPASFVFSFESLPTFIPRLGLEIVQMHVLMLAVVKVHRSSFGFIRTITIPLLLVVDMVLGYAVGSWQIIGMGVIFLTLILLFLNGRIKRKGAGLALFTAVNAVITISLYKYNISHFNSVVGEQLIIFAVLLFYFSILARKFAREYPFKFLRKKIFFFQSFSEGLASVAGSFAYLFAPASIILAASRAAAILWSIVAGNKLFNEHHLVIKLTAFAFLAAGIVLLI
ncbi:MAG: hypothetical protein WC862_01570 [Patescibacteria group bacterium]